VDSAYNSERRTTKNTTQSSRDRRVEKSSRQSSRAPRCERLSVECELTVRRVGVTRVVYGTTVAERYSVRLCMRWPVRCPVRRGASYINILILERIQMCQHNSEQAGPPRRDRTACAWISYYVVLKLATWNPLGIKTDRSYPPSQARYSNG
jgi:hypothetical protein